MTPQSDNASLEPILRAVTGYWATSVIGAAVKFSVFDHLEKSAMSIEETSHATGLSQRTTRALLDALSGLGLLAVNQCKYSNTASASSFLVKGKKSYIGEFVMLNLETMPKWQGFSDAVQSNNSVMSLQGVPEHPYWNRLVNAVSALSLPAAQTAAGYLNIEAAGPLRVLDVGGGAGVFSEVLLRANSQLQATQIDWANVNEIARNILTQRGVGNRFNTIDGDMFSITLENNAYDLIVYSHMAHAFTPDENLIMFRKFGKALRNGGTLVLNEYLVNDDGSGHPFVLLFSANIIFHSTNGTGWRENEYRAWLSETGFNEVHIQPTTTPATLIYAR